MSTRTALYRHWDSSGNLLYVGISLSAVQRLSQHRHSSHWFDMISSVTIEWHGTRDEAMSAEVTAIRKERPIYNRVHNAANDNRPHLIPETVEADEPFKGPVVFAVRSRSTKKFQGIFWGRCRADLWDVFDEFGDPYGFEFAKIEEPGALCHTGLGVKLKSRETLSECGHILSWSDFEKSESFTETLLDIDNLDWEPFCTADDAYGLIARVTTKAA